MEWEDRDTYTGYSPYHIPLGQSQQNSPTLSSGSKASRKSLKLVTPIGKLSVDSQQSSHFEQQSYVSPERHILNQLDLPQLKPIVGKRTQESQSPSSSLGSSPSIRRAKLTGKWFGKPLQLEESWKFPLISEYSITGINKLILGPSEQLVVISRSLLRILEPAMSTGVRLVLENLAEHGKKPEYQLIVKVLDQSSGMGIKLKNVLCSMNLEEASMSRTCCDGLIVIRYEWKSKVPQCRYL